ncbi:MAG TPA: HD domain-containing phosphohydrolase [Candidatus Dormibacteraeota bacterium]
MAERGREVRLAELITALSLATDLGMGQPMEKAMRSTLIALGLGNRLNCDAATLSDIYYLGLLEHIGCTAHAHEWAGFTGGDEITMRTHAVTFANSPMSEVMAAFIRHVGEGLPLRQRAALVAATMREGNKRFKHISATQCEAAVCLAQRMRLSPAVVNGLGQTLETWNGKGGPARLKGDQIQLSVRVVAVAHDAEVFERVGGLDACLVAVKKRRAAGYDPNVADIFLQNAREIFAMLPEWPLHDAVLDAEPEPQVSIAAGEVDGLARAFADFVDLKSPYTTGHSTAVAALAETAARAHGVAAADIAPIRQAALLHDLGRVAVHNGIWEAARPLTSAEWERVRLHPYHTDRILDRAPLLQPLATLASSHHERLDGAGYHRGSLAAHLPMPARLLAAADAYQAMTQERPYRPALSPDEAVRELRREVEAGRLDRAAGESVLEAAGHTRQRTHTELPAGLSERELEVLREICLGHTNKQMAQRLHIAEKTVGHHVQHIYNKIGRSTRAGAALFAMENGLIS